MRNINDDRAIIGWIIAVIVIVIIIIILISMFGGTRIKDIQEHPNDYLNKEVTIKAYLLLGGKTTVDIFTDDTTLHYSGSIYQKKFMSDEAEAIMPISVRENVDTSILILGGEYKFTGIIKSYESLLGDSGIYLEVTKIE